MALTGGLAFAGTPGEPEVPSVPSVATNLVPAPGANLPPGLAGPKPESEQTRPTTKTGSARKSAKPTDRESRKGHGHRRPFGKMRCLRDNASWLGVNIDRLTPEVRAQLPDLAPGVGFVVREANEDGPAENAGLQANDVVWKINDQLLINEAQLWVLLGMWKPGEVVRIDYFRGGRPASAKLTLGKAPGRAGFDLARNDGPFIVGPPGSGIPLHIVDVPRREASVENDDGQAVLTVDQAGFRIKISDPQGNTIHEGPLFDANGKMQVPEEWRERVESMHSTLTESLKRARGVRPPRMRVIPKAKVDTR